MNQFALKYYASALTLFAILNSKAICGQTTIGIWGGGGTKSFFNSESLVDWTSLGYGGGFQLNHSVNNYLGVITGLEYFNKGVFYPNSNVSLDYNRKINYNYNYLQVPAIFSISTNKEIAHVFVNMGVYGSILVNANIKSKMDDERSKKKITSSVDRWDYGVVLGFGVRGPISKSISLSGEFRNDLGMRGAFSESPWMGNYTFFFMVGVSYQISKN